MRTNRLTISLPNDMEERLDCIKQIKYYNTSKNKMLQDLICIGLDVMEEQIQNNRETDPSHRSL